jgi:hypothetical protein
MANRCHPGGVGGGCGGDGQLPAEHSRSSLEKHAGRDNLENLMADKQLELPGKKEKKLKSRETSTNKRCPRETVSGLSRVQWVESALAAPIPQTHDAPRLAEAAWMRWGLFL